MKEGKKRSDKRYRGSQVLVRVSGDELGRIKANAKANAENCGITPNALMVSGESVGVDKNG